jgi:hypothetical protein
MSSDTSLILRKRPREPSAVVWLAGTAVAVPVWFAVYGMLSHA